MYKTDPIKPAKFPEFAEKRYIFLIKKKIKIPGSIKCKTVHILCRLTRENPIFPPKNQKKVKGNILAFSELGTPASVLSTQL